MAMVKPAPQVRRLRALAAVLGLLALIMAGPAQAQQRFDFFWTGKYGKQTAEYSGDTIIEDFEADHGELQTDREVTTEGLEFDLVTFPSRRAGVGLGFEYHQYFQVLRFRNPEGQKPAGVLNIKGRALLYTLKFYTKLGPLLPFLGIGSGLYMVNYSENSKEPFFEASTDVIHGRVGVRILAGKWSLLLEYGETHAPLTIQTRENMPEIELGGVYTALGIARAF